MKPPPFEYVRPGNLDELLSVLAQTPNAKILAGGQSLMAMLNLRYVFPDTLIDINRVPGLAGISVEGDRMRVGAMTRQRHIETNPLVGERAPIIAEALHLVGHRQTRNRGTIGGSLCHLDPAAELPTVSLLYDAVVHVAGQNGQRQVPMTEFILDYMTPGIEPEEVVIAVEFPLWSIGHGYSFMEFARRHGDFAVASAGCLVECARSGVVERISIAIGGVSTVPLRGSAAEALVTGTQGDDAVIESAVATCEDIEALGDFHGSADYRKSVARSILRKVLKRAIARAKAGSVH
jgi:aerobic carbon-monoxide dehydrogenase medium subunit